MKNAGVQNASRIISALPSDAANVFLALTAKDLNPRIHVATRAFGEDAVGKLHKAGADLVVVPDVVAGLELSREALGLKDSKMHKLVSKR
ncbi:NAD-binding protein [Candidatus Micrarchaeota archaeon]|nr:NAD-binding protein [Candidatus Micrarchaeota archaeon]